MSEEEIESEPSKLLYCPYPKCFLKSLDTTDVEVSMEDIDIVEISSVLYEEYELYSKEEWEDGKKLDELCDGSLSWTEVELILQNL